MRGLLLGLIGTFIPGTIGHVYWGTRGQIIGWTIGVAFVVLIGTLWFGPPGRRL